MAGDRDRSRGAWGGETSIDGDIGASAWDRGLVDGREKERMARRLPHPAVPSLDRLRAFQRALAWLGRKRRNSGRKTDANPKDGGRFDFDWCVLHFVDEVCFEGDHTPSLDTDISLSRVVEDLPDEERPYWRAAILTRARDASGRKLARRLSDDAALAHRMGFDSDDTPHHSTLSRHWDYDEAVDDALDELATRARYSALWAGAEFPYGLRLMEDWGLDEIADSEPTLEEKIVAMQHLIEEGIAVMAPHLSFGRDPDAPAYKLSPTAFLVYFAHLALEDSYAEAGTRTLKLLDTPASVPMPNTVFRYVRELSLDDIGKQFSCATAALLNQEFEQSMTDPSREALTPPIHLAYDTTRVKWYGAEDTRWTTGILPEDNASSAWHFSVLSIVSSDMSYVLGVRPLRKKSHIGSYLHRFLKQTTEGYRLDVGRVYMDSELCTKDAINALRANEVDFLIQGKDAGDIERLLDRAQTGEIASEKGISFTDFSLTSKPNAFAWPAPPEEVGADNRDRDHYPYVTDMDIDERDLEGLGQQFRNRWGIETSIREIKSRYHARCGNSDYRVRAYYFMIATVLYNLSQYVDNRLEERLMVDDVSWSGEEFLHAVRRVDPDNVPDWGDTDDVEYVHT